MAQAKEEGGAGGVGANKASGELKKGELEGGGATIPTPPAKPANDEDHDMMDVVGEEGEQQQVPKQQRDEPQASTTSSGA